MGVIKDGVNHICKRLDDIHALLKVIVEVEIDKKQVLEVIRNNVKSDRSEMKEWLKTGKKPQDLTVQPVEKSNGEKLFLVTGEELCNLLEACKGAKLQMKEK